MGQEEVAGERVLGKEGLHAEDRCAGGEGWGVVQPEAEKRERKESESERGNQTQETFCVYLRTSDKEESLSSDLGRAEN
jgi:hypothetical protein